MPATRVVLAGVLALAVAGLTATFGGLVALDTATREWLLEWRSPGLTALMAALTTLGGSIVLVSLALGVAVWLGVTAHRRREAALVGGATLGALVLGPLLKVVVERTRPDGEHLVLVHSWAYPSGHSLTTTVVVGVLTVLAANRLATRTARLAVMAAGVVLVVAVGVSRIYLGVHWPTDVLAGWLIGGLWLVICLLVYDSGLLGRGSR